MELHGSYIHRTTKDMCSQKMLEIHVKSLWKHFTFWRGGFWRVWYHRVIWQKTFLDATSTVISWCFRRWVLRIVIYSRGMHGITLHSICTRYWNNKTYTAAMNSTTSGGILIMIYYDYMYRFKILFSSFDWYTMSQTWHNRIQIHPVTKFQE